jgi:hypothetical protein
MRQLLPFDKEIVTPTLFNNNIRQINCIARLAGYGFSDLWPSDLTDD